MEFVGWVSSICFSVCSIPQAWYVYKKKDASFMTWPALILWGVGEICGIAYSIYLQDLPIFTNMAVNLVCFLIMFYYKIKRKDNGKAILQTQTKG